MKNVSKYLAAAFIMLMSFNLKADDTLDVTDFVEPVVKEEPAEVKKPVAEPTVEETEVVVKEEPTWFGKLLMMWDNFNMEFFNSNDTETDQQTDQQGSTLDSGPATSLASKADQYDMPSPDEVKN